MSKEKIYIFDTTLRDGAQTEGVDFTVSDKIKIAKNMGGRRNILVFKKDTTPSHTP